MRRSGLTLALEALEAENTAAAGDSSSAKMEDEIVIYAKIGNMAGLEQAKSKESHEQWMVRPEGEASKRGSFRVRKTTKEGHTSYDLTLKLRQASADLTSSQEITNTIDESAFKGFRTISGQGMIKERYSFPATNIIATNSDGSGTRLDYSELFAVLKWEVDVFPDGNGGYHPWCKIDFEINALMDALEERGTDPSKVKFSANPKLLPIQPSEIIIQSSATHEQKELITKLYDDYFLTKLA